MENTTKKLNRATGYYGEKIAYNYVKKILKYKILETNYSNKLGEIDIIAKNKDVTIFIEVKYKNNLIFGYPREEVTNYKQNKIRNVALIYLQANNLLDTKVSFDVVEIIKDDNITYIKNAF